ncbi:MAG: tRNA pseudouridine(55) synthase TruB [Anaerovoracaceae bacterium]|jgi:tRNA pseudouridine55 synthase
MKGIINIDKPQGFTSHDCVAVVRRLTGVRRVGHTGTLDPMATGVLPVCVGNATRIMEYLDNDVKEYDCTMQLGIETDTCDTTGKVISRSDLRGITPAEIERAFSGFHGEISQIPPKYSAIKVNGRKLYEYARSDQSVEIKPRRVTIFDLRIEEIAGDSIRFTVRCSRGTYIRSICRDVGRILGCGAAMSALCRTQSGIFRLQDAIGIHDLREMSAEEIAGILIPVDKPLGDFGRIVVGRDQAKDFIDGKSIPFGRDQVPEETAVAGRYRLYRGADFIGVGDIDEQGRLKADKVFNTELK